MFIILGHWHRLLHVRALLAWRKRGKSEIHQVHDGPSFNSRLRHQERTTSRAPLREEVRRQRILHRPSAQEEVQKEVLPGYPRSICTRWQIPKEYDLNWSNRRFLSPNGWSCGRRSYPPFDSTSYKSNWWICSDKIGSDTMPIRHRSDFKQALSTLRQLKEKEEEAQRNQQWAQSSSSSSWWSWQGSWWTPYSYESHHGDEPSTDWTGQLVFQVIGTLLQGMIFPNSLALLQLDRLHLTSVYCNRRGV